MLDSIPPNVLPDFPPLLPVTPPVKSQGFAMSEGKASIQKARTSSPPPISSRSKPYKLQSTDLLNSWDQEYQNQPTTLDFYQPTTLDFF